MEKNPYLKAAEERITAVMELMRKRREAQKILTDNASELLKVRWDGERFALTNQRPVGTDKGTITFIDTIILNPKEMLDLIEFAGKMGGE